MWEIVRVILFMSFVVYPVIKFFVTLLTDGEYKMLVEENTRLKNMIEELEKKIDK